MSEESLRALLDRIDNDEDFRARIVADPEAAVADLDLTPVERLALASSDEDALRRLAGAEVVGFAARPGMAASRLCGLFEPNTSGCVTGAYGRSGPNPAEGRAGGTPYKGEWTESCLK